MIVLPYKGDRRQRIIRSINKAVKKILPQTMLHRIFIKVRN